MNKKGFTLVELIAVITVITLLFSLAAPKLMENYNDKKNKLYDATIKELERLAGMYLTDNPDIYSDISENGYVNISVNTLCDEEYLTCPVKNPKDNSDIDGYVRITYESDKYNYSYLNKPVRFETDDWATIVAAVQSGNHPYQVGDAKEIDLGETLGEHTIRVANVIPCSEVDTLSQTACGFVLEFTDIIARYNMNTSSTSAGGWPASTMRTYVNDDIYNAIPDELRVGIIDTYVISSHGLYITTGAIENENAGVLESENYWSNDKLYLLSPQEVYGISFSNEMDTSNGTSRQLDYYANYEGENYKGISITNYGGEKKDYQGTASSTWLRSARSINANIFYIITSKNITDHAMDLGTALSTYGVSPAFRLSN